MTKRNAALFEFFINTLVMSITALFPRWLLPLNAFQIVFARSLVAVIFLALLLKTQGESFAVASPKDRRTLIISGVLLTLHWVSLFGAIQIAPIAITFLALFTYPIIIILLEPWFFNEKRRLVDLVLGAVTLLGVYMLQPEFDLSNNVTQGILLGLFSGTAFAVRNLLSRSLIQSVSGIKQMCWQLGVVTLLLSPIPFVLPLSLTPQKGGLLLLLGVVFTALTHASMVRVLAHLKAKTVGLIAVTQLIYSSILAWLIFGEALTLQMLLGGVLIIGSAIYNVLSDR